MAEEEKKQGETSYAERLAKALQSMKGKPLPAHTDDFECCLTDKLPGRVLKK